MRLFAAIELDETTRADIAGEQRRLANALRDQRSSAKWVRVEQIHLTVAFLGEVGPPLADAIVAAFGQPISAGGPFDLTFAGLGMFPPHGPPRVLWVGVQAGLVEVNLVERIVVERLTALGVRLDERPYHPHLTLARWRDSRPRDRRAVAALQHDRVVARTTADAVTLFQSRVSSSGSTYTALSRAQLI